MNKKHFTKVQMVKFARSSIRNNLATWETVAEVLGVTPKTIRGYVSASYSKKSYYRELIAKEKANREALLAQAREVISDEDEVDEVIVTETGALIKKGSAGIMDESLPIFVPFFCIRELEKLSRNCLEAEKVLAYYGSGRITTINLRYREELFSEPSFAVSKSRTIGIVALVCELWTQGYKVRLSTTSKEVAKLAKEQGIDDLIIDFVQ